MARVDRVSRDESIEIVSDNNPTEKHENHDPIHIRAGRSLSGDGL